MNETSAENDVLTSGQDQTKQDYFLLFR